MEEKRHPNLGRLFIGLIVLYLGVTYLGKNMGWFSFNFQLNWDLLVPAIIIAFGLSIISHRGGILSWLIGVVVVLFLAGLIISAGFGFLPVNQNFEVKEYPVTIQKDSSAQRAIVSIDTGAGNLKIDGQDDTLVTGKLVSSITSLKTNSGVSGTSQNVELTTGSKTNWGWNFSRIKNDLTLGIAKNIPIDLDIDSGAMDMELDLSDIIASKVGIDTGASSLDLTLGDKTSSDVVIDAGASSINIDLPESVGAKVTIDSGVTSKNFNGFTKIDNNKYESPNYASAEKKINIDLQLGASSVTVNRK